MWRKTPFWLKNTLLFRFRQKAALKLSCLFYCKLLKNQWLTKKVKGGTGFVISNLSAKALKQINLTTRILIMNALLLTAALFSNQAPVIDTEQWFDLDSVRAEMTAYVREEASNVATFIKKSITDGLEAGAEMMDLVEEQDHEGKKQTLAKSE
jgi:hypothetical protein